jgi:DNA-binding response OmpR family regulator
VVEDHSSLREMLALYLGRFGYRILSARDGAAALAILDAEEVHVILLDLMLPHVDGFELLRTLGERRRDGLPYVIVVSAILSDEKRQQALSLGADEYVSKPFNLSNLLERIRAIEERIP